MECIGSLETLYITVKNTGKVNFMGPLIPAILSMFEIFL